MPKQLLFNLTSDHLKRDSISCSLFTLYFNRAFQQIKDERQKETKDCRDINPRWVEKMERMQHSRRNKVCWWLWLYHRNRKDKGQDLWSSRRNHLKEKPVSEQRKDWIYHREKRIKRREKMWQKWDQSLVIGKKSRKGKN